MTKVVYIDDIPTPYRVSIHERISRSVADYEVWFCAAEEPGRSFDLRFDGLTAKVLSGWQFRPPSQQNPISVKLNFSVISELKKANPSLVVLSGYLHPTMWLAVSWCRFHGVPVGLATESSADTASKAGLVRGFRNLVVRTLFSRIAFALPVSKAAGKEIRRLTGRPDLALHQFPNTPDLDRIDNILSQNQQAIHDKKPLLDMNLSGDLLTVVFVGRFIPAKRPSDVMPALCCLLGKDQPEIQLLMIGAGELADELKAQASETQMDVRFPGWIENYEALISLVACCDVMVLPSQHEPWGAVVNEAMACGLCVVASDRVGAAADMIEDGENGLLFKTGDVAALSDQLKKCTDVNFLERIKCAAKGRAPEFGQDLAVSNFLVAMQGAIHD